MVFCPTLSPGQYSLRKAAGRTEGGMGSRGGGSSGADPADASVLTSDVVNYLVMRYLQESGFNHTAFCFGHESNVAKSPNIDPNNVPPGSLITFIQKGMQYLEMEANLSGQVRSVPCMTWRSSFRNR